MQRGVTSTVSLLLVCLCLTISGSAAASVTASPSGTKLVSHGAAGRHMLQESDQTPADAEPTEELQDSAQQDTPADTTETSSDSSATDNTPDVSELDATESKDTEAGKAKGAEGEAAKAEEAAGQAAEAASEPDSATLSPDADDNKGESSAEESSSSASTSRQLPEVNSASSAKLMQSEEDDMASSDEGQAAAASDTARPDTDVPAGAQVDDSQAAGLSFDEASAQSAIGAELSDPTPPSNSSSSSSDQNSSDDLTFDQAVAATNGNQSITDMIANTTQSMASELKVIDPREMSPVLESLLPSIESLNGSLSAAIQEPEGASNATAASSGEDSHTNATDWAGLANATITKVGEELVKTANASVSSLDEDVSAIPVNASAINATQDVITGAASSAAGVITTASGLLSNATSALTATTNTTALSATNATLTAGGSESDSLLGSEVLNATVADGVLHSSVDKVAGVLGGVKSWLNSSMGGEGKQGLQGAAGETELAGNSSSTLGGAVNASSVAPGSILGRPEAHTATQGVTGATANATDAVFSLSRAAAAELGTEEDTLTAQTSNRVNQSARSTVLPGLSDDEDAIELENVDTEALPVHASASRTAAAKSSNTTGSASTAVSLADQRAAEVAQDGAEQRASQQQAGSLTQPNRSGVSAHKPKTQAQALEDEADAEQDSLQHRHNSSTGTAKTARYADGQLVIGGVNPSENEDPDNFANLRAHAQHEITPGVGATGSHSSGGSALPAGAHSTQTGQLFDEEYDPQVALGNNLQSEATGVSQHSKTAPTFDEEYGGGGEGGVVPGRAGAAAASALTAGAAASQAARAKTQKELGTSSQAVKPQVASTGQDILPGKRPQAGLSASQGTSASSVGGGLPSGRSRDSPLPGSSGVSQPRTGSAVVGNTGSSTKYDDDYDDDESLLLGQHTRSGSATASDSATAGSKALPNIKPLASGASDTLTPAQQRELERESAYQASTGIAAASLLGTTTSTASGKAKASSHPSWATIAGQSDADTAEGGASTAGLSKPGSVANLGQSSSTGKQQSLGDGESDADMEDYDPRAFAIGSTADSVTRTTGDDPTGQWNPRTAGGVNTGVRVQPSMGGEEAYDAQQEGEGDSSNFMATRDPTDPNSVVNAQDGQLHQHSTGIGAVGAGSATAAEKTHMGLHGDQDEKVPLLAGAQAEEPTGSKQSGSSLYTSDDELAGPIVTGVGGDQTTTQQRQSSKQSAGASSTLHGLLDNVINNWVVITALSALVCTGAVLGFVFLRGFAPSPYDAITISNSGSSTYASSGGGYAGNNGYHGVSMKDEENGWESWADDDVDAVPRVKKGSNGNSPSRGTGVGKLKKGTFAKKKPANWSNDF